MTDDPTSPEAIAGCEWCDEEGLLYRHDGTVARCSHRPTLRRTAIEETLVRIEYHLADLVAVLSELVGERGRR